ncbi:MAG: DMT family transporter [Phycisphaerae bacterium]|jgi:drug/metabolite transporter (DMT)-like permease
MGEISDATLGAAAGITVSVCWTFTSLFFSAASRRVGPLAVNAYRIVLAVILLACTHRALAGAWIPPAGAKQALFLAGSGLIGLTIGDGALLSAYVQIGPRVASLIMTTAPLMAAVFGWFALGERLSVAAWAGVLLTVGGVAWVVGERSAATGLTKGASRARGVALALVAAACQAAGLVLSKQGMGYGWLPPEQRLTPQAATLLRMAFACLGVLPLVAWHRLRTGARCRPDSRAPTGGEWRSGLALASLGAVGGPYLGVWLSLEATARVSVGVAQTLCSLPPIFILPFSAWLHRERIGARAILGAVAAVAGVAVLVLTG